MQQSALNITRVHHKGILPQFQFIPARTFAILARRGKAPRQVLTPETSGRVHILHRLVYTVIRGIVLFFVLYGLGMAYLYNFKPELSRPLDSVSSVLPFLTSLDSTVLPITYDSTESPFEEKLRSVEATGRDRVDIEKYNDALQHNVPIMLTQLKEVREELNIVFKVYDDLDEKMREFQVITQIESHPNIIKAKEQVEDIFATIKRIEQTVNRFEMSLMNIYSLITRKMFLDDVDLHPILKGLEGQYYQITFLVEPIKEMSFALFEVKRNMVHLTNTFRLSSEDIEAIRAETSVVRVGDMNIEYKEPQNGKSFRDVQEQLRREKEGYTEDFEWKQ